MLREVQLRKERWLKEMAMEKKRKESPRENNRGKRVVEPPQRREPIRTSSSERDATRARESKQSEQLNDPRERLTTTMSQKPNNQVESHMQSYLASQLLSHTCPICYEVMKGQDRSPILVIPCGHSFCQSCLQTYGARERSRESRTLCCPVCRTEVDSWAVNQTLKSLIESFLQSRSQLLLEQKKQETPPHMTIIHSSNVSNNVIQYTDKISSLATRMAILVNERADAQRRCKESEEKAQAFRRAQKALQSEEAKAEAQLERAKQELELVRKHLHDQRAKEEKAVEELQDALKKVDMVSNSLRNLQAEHDKVNLLLQACQQNSLSG